MPRVDIPKHAPRSRDSILRLKNPLTYFLKNGSLADIKQFSKSHKATPSAMMYAIERGNPQVSQFVINNFPLTRDVLYRVVTTKQPSLIRQAFARYTKRLMCTTLDSMMCELIDDTPESLESLKIVLNSTHYRRTVYSLTDIADTVMIAMNANHMKSLRLILKHSEGRNGGLLSLAIQANMDTDVIIRLIKESDTFNITGDDTYYLCRHFPLEVQLEYFIARPIATWWSSIKFNEQAVMFAKALEDAKGAEWTRRYFHEKSHYIWPNLLHFGDMESIRIMTEDLEVPYYFAACHIRRAAQNTSGGTFEFVIRHSPVTTLSAWKYDVVCQGTLEMVKLFHQKYGFEFDTRAKVQNLIDMASFNHMDREKVEDWLRSLLCNMPAPKLPHSHFSSILKNAIPGSDDSETQYECSICMCKITKKDLYVTKCGHMYHEDCMRQQLTYKTNCPMCRMDLTEEV